MFCLRLYVLVIDLRFLVAAVQVLMTRIEDNPFSEWTSLLTQLVRAAMDCQGQFSRALSATWFQSDIP